MSQKLAVLRVVRVNETDYFVTGRKTENGDDKTFAQIRREFERYEARDVDSILPVAFMDQTRDGRGRVADLIESKEFTSDDLPFVI